MDDLFAQFINTYGVPILYAILTALAGLLASAVKKLYAKYINDHTKQTVARTVVMAVQQLYEELNGPEKFDIALESMTEMLKDKGITITALEARMLIEAAVGEFKGFFYRIDKSEPDDIEDQPIDDPEPDVPGGPINLD